MRIVSKKQFYALWHQGRLGNKPRTWKTLKELEASGYAGELTIRTIGGAGGRTLYRVPAVEAGYRIEEWAGTPTFNESMPDEYLTVQGELARLETGLYFRYDMTPNRKFNEAMKHARTVERVAVEAILEQYLWPSSLDDVREFLDLYPGHVIELSAYDQHVGELPHRNTIIWEIRSY